MDCKNNRLENSNLCGLATGWEERENGPCEQQAGTCTHAHSPCMSGRPALTSTAQLAWMVGWCACVQVPTGPMLAQVELHLYTHAPANHSCGPTLNRSLPNIGLWAGVGDPCFKGYIKYQYVYSTSWNLNEIWLSKSILSCFNMWPFQEKKSLKA